ncbi:MAG: lipase [Thermoleophilaceae bacterium]|nr:lipase [Thermoleophilaceae bacterium]
MRPNPSLPARARINLRHNPAVKNFLLGLCACLLALPAAAQAVRYSPVDQAGPALTVSADRLAASLHCEGALDNASRAPILLVPGTGSTPEENFSWNYEVQFRKLGIPFCDVTLPEKATADIQVAAEYVVNGIRVMRARSGRQISVLGHSQGGMVPRWAFRFWPDTRPMVDDLIGLAPANHGTTQSDANGTGLEASLQQGSNSQFTKALNSFKETFAGISYTVIYTRADEVVTPNGDDNGSSSLHTGDGRISNTAVQDICPADTYEHVTVGTIDPVAYELAIDALGHDGPADRKRISAAVCGEVFHPGAKDQPLDGLQKSISALQGQLSVVGVGGRRVNGEPALKCYVTVECSAATGLAPGGCTKNARLKLRVGRGAKVRVNGRRVKVRRGYARIVVRAKRRTTVVRIKRGGKTRTRKFAPCLRRRA